MMSPTRSWRDLPWTSFLAGATLSLVYLYFFAMQAFVQFELNMLEPRRAWFKIYWADADTGYSESRVRRVLINGTDERYQLRIGNLGDIHKLRIDPVEFRTEMVLRRLTIKQQGYETVAISPENDFEGLRAVQEIEGVVAKPDGLRYIATGRDPQFELLVNSSRASKFPFAHILIVMAIMVATFVTGRIFGALANRLAFVPVLMLIAVILALIMAVVSRDYWLHPNGESRIFVHPDEEAHSIAVEYYRDHWLPPNLTDPSLASSYSIYGYTRLASYELYYPLAGYFTRLLSPFKTAPVWNARLFGLLLFGFVAWLTWRKTHFRPLALPLLLSSQIWYVFSYSNSDGFSLIIATLAGWQAASPDSQLNRMLTEPNPHRFWWHVLWLGLLAGALFLIKVNFYFFILFLGLYVLWRLVNGDYPDQARFWKRLILIGFVGLAVYSGRLGLDYAANGPDPGATRLAMVEEMARNHYKPSTELSKKHIYIQMRDRGVSLHRLMTREKWGGKSFVSSFGAYGYTQYLGGPVYYGLAKVTGIVLLGLLFLGILIYGSRRLHWLLAITGGTAGLLLIASVWQSWTISFQPQGRYLAPILPMLGMLWFHTQPAFESRLIGRVTNVVVIAMFALAVYSFVIVGLSQIPKFY